MIEYGVDLVHRVLQEMSGRQDVPAFQWGSDLYFVTHAGFGYIRSVYPEKDSSQHPSVFTPVFFVKETTDSLGLSQRQIIIDKKHRARVKPMAVPECSEGFSLKYMREIALKLDEMPLTQVYCTMPIVGGKFVEYAPDMSVSGAWVASRDELFESLRREEHRLMDEVVASVARGLDSHEVYARHEVPCGFVMTPQVIFAFPFERGLATRGTEVSARWSHESRIPLDDRYHSRRVGDVVQRSIIGSHIALNSMVTGGSGRHAVGDALRFQYLADKDLKGIDEALTDAQPFFDRWNNLHNALFAKEIRAREEFRRRLTQ